MTKYQISKPMGAVVPPSPPENFPETSSVEPRFNPKSSNRPAARLLKRYRDGRGVTRGGAKGAHCFGRRKVPTMWYVLPSIQYICSKRPQIRTWGPRPASCPGRHLNSACPCEKDLKKTFTAAIKHSSLNNAPIRASLLCLRVFFQHVSMATVSCSARWRNTTISLSPRSRVRAGSDVCRYCERHTRCVTVWSSTSSRPRPQSTPKTARTFSEAAQQLARVLPSTLSEAAAGSDRIVKTFAHLPLRRHKRMPIASRISRQFADAVSRAFSPPALSMSSR